MKGRILVNVGAALLKTASRRNIDLAPDDRFNARMGAFAVKIHDAEQVAVISHGERREFELPGTFNQVLYAYGTVEETVFCMQVEGYEIRV